MWKFGLPQSYRQLLWDKNLPSNTLPLRDAVKILTTGFAEYNKTLTSSKSPGIPFPRGKDSKDWLSHKTVQSEEFKPVRSLISFWEKNLMSVAPTLLIHGSCATLDGVQGYSDLDTLMILSDKMLINEELFLENQFHHL